MRRPSLRIGFLQAVVLQTLQQLSAGSNGQISKILKSNGIRRTNANIWTTLSRLQNRNFIQSAMDTSPRPRRGGRPERIYTLTKKGLTTVQNALTAVDRFR